MHPLELAFVGGVEEALELFGLSKEAALTPADKARMLEAYRARPKGIAAVQGASGIPAAPVAKPSMAPGPASHAQMLDPSMPPVLPGSSGLELNREGYQGGYGTAGKMPGAVMGARGQVHALPNKLAGLLL